MGAGPSSSSDSSSWESSAYALVDETIGLGTDFYGELRKPLVPRDRAVPEDEERCKDIGKNKNREA